MREQIEELIKVALAEYLRSREYTVYDILSFEEEAEASYDGGEGWSNLVVVYRMTEGGTPTTTWLGTSLATFIKEFIKEE